MFLSALISEEGLDPENIETTASVYLEKDDTGPVINRIDLNSKISCPGLSNEKFNKLIKIAKENCPISRLYASAQIELSATLE
jgi:osmotically inducible protein OsmC